MKRTAIEACRLLAGWIFESESNPWHLWRIVDRIERRFGIQGAAEHELNRLRGNLEAWRKEQSRLADIREPNRLSYLHR